MQATESREPGNLPLPWSSACPFHPPLESLPKVWPVTVAEPAEARQALAEFERTFQVGNRASVKVFLQRYIWSVPCDGTLVAHVVW